MWQTTNLFRTVFKKQAILLLRYPVNTFSQIVTIYIFFVIIFYGGQAVAGPALTDTIDGLIVGFFLYTMTIVAYSGLAWNVTREAQWGTLEQLYMSPFGFGRVMVVKAAVNVIFSLVWGGVILALMVLTTGRSLYFDIVTLVGIGVLTLVPVIGVGFVFAGLALLYKRIENLFQLVQFAFIALIAAPLSSYRWLAVLPLVEGSRLLQLAIREGTRLWEFPATDLGILLGTAIVYFVGGYYLFQRAQHRARRRGLLGHY